MQIYGPKTVNCKKSNKYIVSKLKKMWNVRAQSTELITTVHWLVYTVNILVHTVNITVCCHLYIFGPQKCPKIVSPNFTHPLGPKWRSQHAGPSPECALPPSSLAPHCSSEGPSKIRPELLAKIKFFLKRFKKNFFLKRFLAADLIFVGADQITEWQNVAIDVRSAGRRIEESCHWTYPNWFWAIFQKIINRSASLCALKSLLTNFLSIK